MGDCPTIRFVHGMRGMSRSLIAKCTHLVISDLLRRPECVGSALHYLRPVLSPVTATLTFQLTRVVRHPEIWRKEWTDDRLSRRSLNDRMDRDRMPPAEMMARGPPSREYDSRDPPFDARGPPPRDMLFRGGPRDSMDWRLPPRDEMSRGPRRDFDRGFPPRDLAERLRPRDFAEPMSAFAVSISLDSTPIRTDEGI